MQKELKSCKSSDELKANEKVKKKASDYVNKYMKKYEREYKRSPDQDQEWIMKFLIYVMWCFRKCRMNYIIHVFIYKIHLHMNLMHMFQTQWMNGVSPIQFTNWRAYLGLSINCAFSRLSSSSRTFLPIGMKNIKVNHLNWIMNMRKLFRSGRLRI